MTDQELINYYANLLILQYIGKSNAYATIQAVVTPVIMNQLPLAVQNAFNLDGTAEGTQLDVIGKYVGVTRSGYDIFNNPITLDDDDFLKFIKLAIVTNNAGSDLATIQSLLNTFFPGEIFVFDYKDMRMSYFIISTIGSENLAELFITQHKLPKPMGVQLGITVFAPVLTTFYGFRTYDFAGMNNSPMNTYDDYETDRPWLTYDYGLTP